MTNRHMVMTRQGSGENNHVFLYLDQTTELCKIPQVTALILTPKSDSAFQRNLVHDCPGYHLSVPIYLAPFLSLNELKMLIHLRFLESTTLSGGFQEIRQIYKDEDAFAIISKLDAIKSLWHSYSTSANFKILAKENPGLIIINFGEILHSNMMLRAVGETIGLNKLIWNLLKHLSDEQLSTYLDNTALIHTNNIFNMADTDFLNVTKQIFAA